MSCRVSDPSTHRRPRNPETARPQTIEGAINIGLAVIAVLRRAEFWEGHVTSDENIPPDEVPDRLDEIDLIIRSVICAAGYRSSIA